jgi:hypothetical protein
VQRQKLLRWVIFRVLTGIGLSIQAGQSTGTSPPAKAYCLFHALTPAAGVDGSTLHC